MGILCPQMYSEGTLLQNYDKKNEKSNNIKRKWGWGRKLSWLPHAFLPTNVTLFAFL